MSTSRRHERSISPLGNDRRLSIRSRIGKVPDCRLCRRDHPLRTCHHFLQLNFLKKLYVVRKYSYCKNCLAHSHQLRKCRSKERCRECGAKHHTLLHRNENRQIRSRSNTSESRALCISHSITLIPTAIIKVKLGNEWVKIRGVLDPSTVVSKIAEFIVKRYNVATERSGSSRLCKISFQPHFGDGPFLNLNAQVSNSLPKKLRSEDLDERIADPYKNLRLADPKFYTSRDINIVLGADIYPQIIKATIHQGTMTTPMAHDTLLGWTLIGKYGI